MASGQISPLSIPLPPLSSVSHPLLIIQKSSSPLMVISCALVVCLRIAAVSTSAAPPCPVGFLGVCLVPWLSARIRLRWDRITHSPACIGPRRGSPVLQPACGSPVLSDSARPDLRKSGWPEPGLALGFMTPPVFVDIGVAFPLLQLSQAEPMGFSIQAEKPSQAVDQAALLSRADLASQATPPSRARLLIQVVKPCQSPNCSLNCPRTLCGRDALFGKTRWSAELKLSDEVDAAQFIESFTYV